ncbi:MAG: metal-sensitive transcriptional regulator [Desulfitobacteriaceae bacterium]|nr:metal-sensitive transcriptional regulator [Desulfitobacteriaceae bacterium]MDI6914906.1 metal-sensitive transcriptional regulator [Desulfitobacteriaceae bacterium]
MRKLEMNMRNTSVIQNGEILKRLKVTKGHVGAIVNMIEEDKPCEEILLQLEAIRASLLKISIFIAQHYAEVCISDALEKGEKHQEILNKSIETLMRVNQYCVIHPDFSYTSSRPGPSSEQRS